MADLKGIAKNVILGRPGKDSPLYPDMIGQPGVNELTAQAIAEGISAEDILKKGLLPGIQTVGEKMKNNEVFIPEVLQSVMAFKAGSAQLKPLLKQSGVKSAGKIVIGTVKGDLHDIGKSLVAMMLEGAGFEVVDLGVDVTPERFVSSVEKEQADILAMSAMLTTTMPGMLSVVKALKSAEVRHLVKVVVGGAPVTLDYANEIGADAWALDAGHAVERVQKLVGR